MVDNVKNLGAVSNTSNVSKTSASAKNDSASIHNNYADDVGDGLEINSKPTFAELLENGTLTQDKFLWFKQDSYKYVCDGKKTLGEIKAELGLADGIIKKRNYGYDNDKTVPKEGTKLSLRGEDFPREKASFQDDDGNEIDGFEKSINGKLYYITQYGDSANALEDGKFKNKSLKDYNTGSAVSEMKYDMRQVWEHKKEGDLATDVAYEVPEKSWWQKIFG